LGVTVGATGRGLARALGVIGGRETNNIMMIRKILNSV
jgi:hypothetical protein